MIDEQIANEDEFAVTLDKFLGENDTVIVIGEPSSEEEAVVEHESIGEEGARDYR